MESTTINGYDLDFSSDYQSAGDEDDTVWICIGRHRRYEVKWPHMDNIKGLGLTLTRFELGRNKYIEHRNKQKQVQGKTLEKIQYYIINGEHQQEAKQGE